MDPRDQIQIIDPTEPLHYQPATGRELRAQSVHRLQVGLFGLCAMLLIIGLASIIMDRAKITDAQTDPIGDVIAKDSPEENKGVDPLADIGVVPAADPTPEAEQTGAVPAPDPMLAP